VAARLEATEFGVVTHHGEEMGILGDWAMQILHTPENSRPFYVSK